MFQLKVENLQKKSKLRNSNILTKLTHLQESRREKNDTLLYFEMLDLSPSNY